MTCVGVNSVMPPVQLRLSLLVAAVAAMPVAAQSGAWFGTPLPPPLSDPRTPIMKHDDAFGPAPVQATHRTGRHDELLDGTALKTNHKKIVSCSLERLVACEKVCE